MSTGTQTCDIVIPGYVLTERIGSGGYAEVWRAEAPGGIEKAVKVVYGYYDDEFASQELKALERIKGVRHPFLLSLERFEIVSGRLAILTELADMSLDQRLRQCRAEGLPGIPRAELLQYMEDAAEALDYLSQRHSLLHLDIKPENLLILGDHIKVADFGLVKELATRTQNSLVSGMTPTYASPEMFDDEPSAHSDQYSLAIVYQEMLVGAVPFPGRTAAQLAKQHTQVEPQLTSLPADDRPIVARALAKQPTSRFPSCKAFVEALMHRPPLSPGTSPPEIPKPIPPAPRSPTPGPDDTTPPSMCTTLRRGAVKPERTGANVTQPIQRQVPQSAPTAEPRRPEEFVPEETTDVPVPDIVAGLRREQPTLYLATGGVGIQMLCRLRELMAPLDESTDSRQAAEFIAIDTDRDQLREACSGRWRSPLSSDEILHLPLRLPKDYDNAREILGWVSRRWLYNIPRSLETRGYRPLGRVALVDHASRVRELVNLKLKRLAAAAGLPDSAGQPRESRIKVVILTGTGGGTGAGMVIDVANAAKSTSASQQAQIELHGYFACTIFANNSSSPLAAANSYSLLTELNHAMSCGNKTTCEEVAHTEMFESPGRPFDYVYWVPVRPRTRQSHSTDAIEIVARYLAHEGISEAREVLHLCRTSPTPRERACERALHIRKLGFASFQDQRSSFVVDLAADLVTSIKHYWLAKDSSSNWERLVRQEQKAASVPTPEPAGNASPTPPPPVAAAAELKPLELRARFKEHMSLEFTSEMLRHIGRQLESKNERGQRKLLPRDAKQLTDLGRRFVAAIDAQMKEKGSNDRFAESPTFRPLIVAASRRIIGDAVEHFDPNQPERFLDAETVDEAMSSMCQSLLAEALADQNFSAEITSLMELGKVAEGMLQCATSDLFQCGSDRRTLIFSPKASGEPDVVVGPLQAARPSAVVVPAEVDEVLVVSEEAGISPRSVALGLERAFPGIADAARRLFTRVDINWQDVI